MQFGISNTSKALDYIKPYQEKAIPLENITTLYNPTKRPYYRILKPTKTKRAVVILKKETHIKKYKIRQIE